ncbi:MAG TPA: phosphoglucosamine mutase [Acidimicrobiales bacterium]|nr:phosphoglucosamine mutase [Acidimicrobiales bacterium]
MLKFGTDGVRGVANQELTPELVLALGRAAARVLPATQFVIGRDTRRSGPLLESALVAGLTAEGADVIALGVVPTPAVAWVAARDGIAGAVVSASHNPYQDNGIKLFGPGGHKLSDEVEAALEEELHRILRHEAVPAPRTGDAIGTVDAGTVDVDAWTTSVIDSIDGRRLDGMALVVDCANGAASHVAPAVLRALGAEVAVLHADPDGTNINAGCGSTHPEDLQRAVLDHGAAVGIAFDGDADRALAVDAGGQLVDGDQIIAITAIDRHQRGLLARDTVVVTVMTNLGFRLGMAERGIEVLEVPVGDRYVLEALADDGLVLGGEQSGHVIFADRATTGDGLLTAVQLLDVVARTGRPLAALAEAAMTRLPQVLRNVRVDGGAAEAVAAVADEAAAVEQELGPRGRVLIRPSGTEPLVRVMAEAPTAEQAEAAVARLVAAIEAR